MSRSICRGVVGSDIRLNGDSYRVVGVMPEGFSFPNRDIDLYVPFAFTPEQERFRGEVEAFLHPLPVSALWGVGERTAHSLQRLGLKTVGDIAALPKRTLERAIGDAVGAHLWNLANGNQQLLKFQSSDGAVRALALGVLAGCNAPETEPAADRAKASTESALTDLVIDGFDLPVRMRLVVTWIAACP